MDQQLIHITSEQALGAIAREGLKGISYWALEGEVSDYYEEVLEDEGLTPYQIKIPLSVLVNFELQPDYPGLEEPLTYTLGKKEEDIWEEWENTDKTWEDSLDLIQSVRTVGAIPVDILLKYNPDLGAYLGVSKKHKP